jgi:tetratricopeptide (TPR) repeat protein
MAEESRKTFFSYAREDSAFVLRLVKELRAAGADVWLDQLDIGPSQYWDTAIENALRACPCHVTVLSPDAVASQDVRNEYSFALEERKQVIPLLYRDCNIPFRLRLLQYVDFRTDYEKGFRDLAQALGIRNAPAVPAPPVEPVDGAQKPFATGPQVETGKQAGAEAQAIQPARLAEQPSPVIAASEARVQEDHRKIGEGQPVLTGQRIWFKPRILWATGAGLIVLVLIIWGISSSKAPDNSGGNVQVTPTATPVPDSRQIPTPTSTPAPTPATHRLSAPISTPTPIQANHRVTVPASAPVSTPTPENSPPTSTDAQEFYKHGYDLFEKKQYDPAIEAFTLAIRLKQDYVDAYIMRGKAYNEKGEYDQSIQDCNQALKLKPDYVIAYYNRGNFYRNKGDNDQAIQDYDQALKLKPDFAIAYYNRGLSYFNKSNYDRAIQDYDQALMLNPNYADAYNNRGVAYQYKKQYQQALQDYDHALQIDPNVKNAQKNRDDLAAYLKAQAGR